MKCRILIVDDHPLLRDGLSRLIQSEQDLVLCGQAENAVVAMRQIEASAPDVAIVDIVLPGSSDGIELTKNILAVRPEVKVMILSMHDDAVYVERAFKAGARGYVTKQEVSRVILSAIRTVWSGGTYTSQRVQTMPYARLVASKPGARASWGIGGLTNRERELLEMLGRGLTRTQIAERLGLSVKTVEAHREHMRTKLKLKTSAELLRYAIKWMERAGEQ